MLINTSSIYELIYRFTIIKQKMDIYFTVFLLSIYIFCWSYLLITADFSHISETFLDLLKRSITFKDPFID